MDTLRQDIRYALRTMRRSPAFTLTVLLTLGIGIGANTAIFSFVDTMLLRPLPYPDPHRMVMIWEDFSGKGGRADEWFTLPDFRDVQERAPSLEAVTALLGWGPSLTGAGEPEQLTGAAVHPAWFDVVGLMPALGRRFLEADHGGDGSIVVLSHALWQRRFGGDAEILGHNIQLNGEAFQVVGIMPPDFKPPFQQAELWRPITRTTIGRNCGESRSCYVLRVMARVRGGASVASAGEELAGIAAAIRDEDPGEKDSMVFRIVGLHEELMGNVKPALIALLAAVGMLLLIACVNIANLLLARSSAREREVAVRTAIGARRGAILRQLLVESTVLGLAGGAVGTLLALWGVNVLRSMSPENTPRLEEVAVDGRVLLFAVMLSVLTGILFGMAPALQLARTDLTRALREAAGPRTSGARKRLRSLLVITEMALALTLLAGAGLLIRSFARLQAVDPGFRAENVLTVNLNFPASRYTEANTVARIVEDLLDRLGSRSDLQAAGASTIIPLNQGDNDSNFLIEGRPLPRDRTETPIAWYRQVTSGYFAAIGMRVVAGRGFTHEDQEAAMPVAVVNETLARRHWPDADPIGQRVSFGGPEGPWASIVGIVADARQSGLDQPTRGEMFLPLAQQPARGVTLVLRGRGDPLSLVPAVRGEVAAIDADLPLGRVATMQETLRQSVALPRLYLSFFAFFALVALVLAAVGIYGVTAHAVAQRTSEIGVRMALGADAGDVLRLVLRQTLVLVVAGLGSGIVLALALSRLMAGLLFDLSPQDPATFISIGLILTAVALIASWVPARRATRVDPLRALRTEM
jgi:predicted permease